MNRSTETRTDSTTTSASSSTGWGRYWAGVDNEDWLAAHRLIELSPRVGGFFRAHLAQVPVAVFDDDGCQLGHHAELCLDWQAAADHLDGEGFSATEQRLARLACALATGAPLEISSLALMGSWATDVWAVLADWGPDGRACLTVRR